MTSSRMGVAGSIAWNSRPVNLAALQAQTLVDCRVPGTFKKHLSCPVNSAKAHVYSAQSLVHCLHLVAKHHRNAEPENSMGNAPAVGCLENGCDIMGNKVPTDARIVPVYYEPATTYNLDLEVFPVSALRQRANTQCGAHTIEHIEFYLLIYITEGRCRHMVDFETIACAQGSLLVVRPGQIQRFDMSGNWQGWILIFRPEFLQPLLQSSPPFFSQQKATATLVAELEIFSCLEMLPTHLVLNEDTQKAVLESIIRMSQDAQLKFDTKTLHMLLRNQLHALLIRLYLVQADNEKVETSPPVFLKRFIAYRLAVERHFQCWHQVAEYAKHLACSEKSLSRATHSVAKLSAKAFLSKRISLEAQRLLSHTNLPITNIADSLGFDEATNFIKFFRREVGCSPGEFRQQHNDR